MDKKVFPALAGVMADLEAVPKNRKVDAPGAKFNYRGIDQALSALHLLLAKYRLILRPEYDLLGLSECGETNSGKTQWRAQVMLRLWVVSTEDGSEFGPIAVPGEGIDTSDKATMKAIANATKYAIYNAFCIPTEEKKDSEEDAGEDKAGLSLLARGRRAIATAAPQDLEGLAQKFKTVAMPKEVREQLLAEIAARGSGK